MMVADGSARASWTDLGMGCCPGKRNNATGLVLYKGSPFDTAEACQAKCEEYGNRCGYIDWGWKCDTDEGCGDYCLVWSVGNDCTSHVLVTADTKCGGQGGDN